MKHLYKFSLLLLALLLPATALAYDFEVDGIYYNINGNEATVTYKGTYSSQYSNEYSGDVTIPTTVTYGGTSYSVTSIGDYAFSNCTGLTSVIIPNSVTTIGYSAFYNCTGLTSVIIGNSVTSIAWNAFSGCTGLTSITVAGSNPKYDSRGNCNAIIESATNTLILGCMNTVIPNSVITIGKGAFSGCTGLTSVTIPNSVASIGGSAFSGCSGLTSVTIGDFLSSIGGSAFSGCTGLTSIVVANGNTTYDSRGNCNAIIETASNTLVLGCKNTVIPNSVISIGGSAFSGCTGLTSVTIPNSVTSIGNNAFARCSGLTGITIPNSITSIGYSAFSGCTGLTSINIPNSVTSIDYNVFRGCTGLTSIDIPNSVTSIGEGAFQGCTGLTSVTIPNSVTTIGDQAFDGCSGLTSIDLPESITSIGYNAFYGTPWLNNQPDGLLYIGQVAFKYIGPMPNETSITIREGTISIASDAFQYCSGLTSITIPNSVTTIGAHAFYGCSSLTSIDIPNSVTSIGGSAFHETAWFDNQPDGLVYAGLVAYGYKGSMPSEANIILREGTLGIASGAFSWCPLTSITIPKSVIYIGYAAFYECVVTRVDISDIAAWCNIRFEGICTNPLSCSGGSGFLYLNGTKITELNIPNSVTSIKDYAFDGCGGLTGVTIPNSVTSIGESAFERCTGLTSITIPNSVTSIGDWAFSGCSSLTNIYCWALTPPTIDTYTFDFSESTTLFVPDIALEAYKTADNWNNFINIVGMPYTFEVGGTSYHATTMSTASVMANNDGGTLYSGDVVIPDSVTYAGMTFAVTGIENNAFDGCYELTNITIPNSVETIGEQAFQGCTGLTSVTIGSGVTAIGTKAFNYCNALETVKCLGTVPPVMASADCFSTAAYNRAQLLVPRNTEATYTAADYWYKFAHIEGWGSAGRGDIDGDGEVSIRDVTRMIDAILTGEHEGVYFESADLNLNGRLDIGDVTSIIDMLLNDIE